MDFEAAFERERKARKRAESILEEKSRELYFSNQKLSENVDSLNTALLENKFLLHVSQCGTGKTELKRLLPTIVIDMMRVAQMPFAVFHYYPYSQSEEAYYSNIIRNAELFSDNLDGEIVDDISDIIDVIKNNALKNKGIVRSTVDLTIRGCSINRIIALPIVSLNHVNGIIFLLSSGGAEKQEALLKVFTDATKQLSIMMEHRYQERKLLESYKKIKTTNVALKEAQKKLIESEKMAIVGQLSAGIAHEINNPMGFIKSNMGTLNEYMVDLIEFIELSKSLMSLLGRSEDSEVKSHIKTLEQIWSDVDIPFVIEDSSNLLNESQNGISRILDIVSGLKRFSRQSDHKKEACDIRQTIEEALKIASNELKYTVNVIRKFDDVKSVLVNSGEMLQVFLNLFINASHAMDESGNLTIIVKNNEQGVNIIVADNGAGIPAEILSSIFNPFFTTKDIGVGTGLGLSISYGIIEDHHGTIEVKSEVGEGTEFSIWLPSDSDNT